MDANIHFHSVYVHQLQATNGMIHAYQTKTLPKLLEVSNERGRRDREIERECPRLNEDSRTQFNILVCRPRIRGL